MDDSETFKAERLSAFSDGVIAIIVTIMVLELHAPESGDPVDLLRLWPMIGAYALSFVFVAIYWVNHHHLLHANPQVNLTSLWLNIHWLFWLSLVPFATSYLNASQASPFSLACYAGLSIITAMAYRFLGTALSRGNPSDRNLIVAPARRRLNSLAVVSNVLAIPAAYVAPALAILLLVIPAGLYFLPDMRKRG